MTRNAIFSGFQRNPDLSNNFGYQNKILNVGTKKLFAFDSDPWANHRAKKRDIKILPRVWYPNDYEKNADFSKVFDVVCLFNVLDRAGAPVSLLTNALSILKPGGLLLISVSVPWRPSPRQTYKTQAGPAYIKVII